MKLILLLMLAFNPATDRLRKVHLVRPDLIPYPLPSEVYC